MASLLGKMPTKPVRLDHAVQAFERVGRVQLGAMLRWKRLVGQHVLLGGIHLPQIEMAAVAIKTAALPLCPISVILGHSCGASKGVVANLWELCT